MIFSWLVQRDKQCYECYQHSLKAMEVFLFCSHYVKQWHFTGAMAHALNHVLCMEPMHIQ